MVWVLSARKERRLRAMEAFRQDRRLVDEDVTVFGEQVAELHVDTLTTELDPDMQQDYRTALESYETAKGLLGKATTSAEVIAVGERLNDGRFARACLLARRDGEPMPQRREPCFFNPQHGPARTDIDWKPPGGVERSIGVCLPDALRLEGGERPDMRLVRVGDRWVPWYAASNETIASQRLQRFSDLPLEAQLYATANGIGRDLGSGLPF